MKPLIWESDQTPRDFAQPVNRTYTHEHLNSNPVPYEAYLQQWDAMAGWGAWGCMGTDTGIWKGKKGQ